MVGLNENIRHVFTFPADEFFCPPPLLLVSVVLCSGYPASLCWSGMVKVWVFPEVLRYMQLLRVKRRRGQWAWLGFVSWKLIESFLQRKVLLWNWMLLCAPERPCPPCELASFFGPFVLLIEGRVVWNSTYVPFDSDTRVDLPRHSLRPSPNRMLLALLFTKPKRYSLFKQGRSGQPQRLASQRKGVISKSGNYLMFNPPHRTTFSQATSPWHLEIQCLLCKISKSLAIMQAPRAPRISEAEWNARRQKLEYLYIDETLSVQETIDVMTREDGFSPT